MLHKQLDIAEGVQHMRMDVNLKWLRGMIREHHWLNAHIRKYLSALK